MEWFDNGWGLAMVIVLPLAGALVVALSQPKSEDLIKGVAFVTVLSTFMVSVLAARRLSPAPGEEIIVDVYLGGIPGLADRYHVTDFGIRLPILSLFGFLAVLAVIYSWKHWRKPSRAKAILMASLLSLGLLILDVIFEEGEPLPLAMVVLLACTFDVRVEESGRPSVHVVHPSVARRCRRHSAGPAGPAARPRRFVCRSFFEEEMRGLVR